MSIYLFIPMRPRDQKKYNAIVKACVRLINKLGFSGISISKVAKDAGVSPATIYIYFDNKDDLFTKLYIDIRYKMSDAALAGLDEGQSIEKQFKSIWHNYMTYAVSHMDYVTYRQQFEQTAMANNVNPQDFELYKYITDLFDRGIKDKNIKNLPVILLVSFSLRWVRWGKKASRCTSGHTGTRAQRCKILTTDEH